MCILPYEPIDLIFQRDNWPEESKDSDVFKRLDDLCKSITENDNPVLLLGQAK